MTLAELIKNALPRAASYHLHRQDIEVLLQHVLDYSYSDLVKNADHPLTDAQMETFSYLFHQVEQGRPIAYLIGYQHFWDIDFIVNENVLVPRPETECLIEAAITTLSENKILSVLELGTGSGVIAITLKKLRPQWQVTATDFSKEALEVAKRNAALQECDIQFILSDWFDEVPQKKFDLIISNPPYIVSDDIHLRRLKAEPQLALVAGEDGLDAIRKIISGSPSYLSEGGTLMVEHGYDQQSHVVNLMEDTGFSTIQGLKDLSGNDRIVLASFTLKG